MAAVTVFTDLDDSLFQTREKALRDPRTSSASLVAAANDRLGRPLSYHGPDQVALISLLRTCNLVPVTGRNREALDRVFSPRFDDYRITSHGAMIYAPSGAGLSSWLDEVEREVQECAKALGDLCGLLSQRRGRRSDSLRVRVIEDGGIPVYVSIKGDSEVPATEIAEIASTATTAFPEIAWHLHHNGRNVAILPPYARKERAVTHVMDLKRERDPDAVFVGLGDSMTDVPYLKLCHFAIIPRHSQIQEVLWG